MHTSVVFFLAVLDPRVDHTMDVLSAFIYILCHSEWLFYGQFCPRLDVVHRGRAWSSSPACIVSCIFSSGNSIVSSWCDHSMLASLRWQCLSVPSLLQLSSEPARGLTCVLCWPRNPLNLSQSFHFKDVKTCFFIVSESPAFTAVRCYRPPTLALSFVRWNRCAVTFPYFLQWCPDCLPSV